jgi:hypothetical protein
VPCIVEGLQLVAVKSVLAIRRDMERHARRCDENQYTY